MHHNTQSEKHWIYPMPKGPRQKRIHLKFQPIMNWSPLPTHKDTDSKIRLNGHVLKEVQASQPLPVTRSHSTFHLDAHRTGSHAAHLTLLRSIFRSYFYYSRIVLFCFMVDCLLHSREIWTRDVFWIRLKACFILYVISVSRFAITKSKIVSTAPGSWQTTYWYSLLSK